MTNRSPTSSSLARAPRIALGLFHFNLQYVAGDEAIYHRYCTQAILPFLEIVAALPWWRVSFEISGSGLEFLATHYPASIRELKRLIASGQIELISSLYSPALWVAFPARDLIRSRQINKTVSAKLGLPDSRIFFSQEAFFGMGLSVLKDEFEIAVCKDEYLRFNEFSVAAGTLAMARLGNLKVVIGSNHLLHEVAKHLAGRTPRRFARHLAAAARTLPHPAKEARRHAGCYWYHMGSGHHFTVPAAPSATDRFSYDKEWAQINIGVLERIKHEGFQFGTISEAANEHATRKLFPLTGLVEGGWNTRESRGVYTWMGKHISRWQDTPAVLGHAWRARSAVRECERLLENFSARDRKRFAASVDKLWKGLLQAEASDPLGWKPTPGEVMFGRSWAETTLRRAHALQRKIRAMRSTSIRTRKVQPKSHSHLGVEDALTQAKAVGNAEIFWSRAPDGLQFCDVHVRPSSSGLSGIKFSCAQKALAYSPSGHEGRLDSCTLLLRRNPAEIFLPLANGLLRIGTKRYLIRLNAEGVVAARIAADEPTVTFAVEGPAASTVYRWRFAVLSGSEAHALATANRLNNV